MTDDVSRSLSRRRFLGAATTATAVTTAGCVSSLLDSSSSNGIEPEEPTEPRRGSPGEFYFFLEENGIAVEELTRDGDDLLLTYRSDAEDVSGSNEEITIIYEVYKQALIDRGSDVEFLYTEISDPFDGQAVGWGIDTDWIHQYDSEGDDGSDSNDGSENESQDESGNESEDGSEGGIDSNQFTLWNAILNTKVYPDDLEDSGGNDSVEDSNITDSSDDAGENVES